MHSADKLRKDLDKLTEHFDEQGIVLTDDMLDRFIGVGISCRCSKCCSRHRSPGGCAEPRAVKGLRPSHHPVHLMTTQSSTPKGVACVTNTFTRSARNHVLTIAITEFPPQR